MTGALQPAETARVAGHFGEFFQGRFGPDGPVVLVTVPCPALGAEAWVEPGAPEGLSEIAQRFFQSQGGLPTKRLRLRCDAALGAGAGMSTASLMALAQVAGVQPSAEALLAAEGAVDPLMLDDPGAVLWASREGRVVQRFGTLPEFVIVGGFFGEPVRTDPDDARFADVADLVDFWASAVTRQDRAALAGLATEGARRTTALRGPDNDPTEALARDLGALGVVRAHTGSARGLLFSPDKVPASVGAALEEAGFSDVLQFRTGGAP